MTVTITSTPHLCAFCRFHLTVSCGNWYEDRCVVEDKSVKDITVTPSWCPMVDGTAWEKMWKEMEHDSQAN